ncbi:unnamed protein product [Toxocara canis]|uniref:G_PROTEIN_RECEP_F1_2 domain-containing protein n=1 Tax=Toxocara canis TaxID=6265 RepID=A0A183V3D3_TOXCA|nr:unnamed protein product [Toxocara canis]
MSSVVFFNALVVAISMLGMRTYVKIAKFIVVCPMSVIILLTVMIFYKFGFRDSMLSIRSTLEPNFRKLMAIRAWTDAVLHVMPSLGVANGIFIVISSMKKFDNNAIRDTVFVVVVDILCSIFSCFLISPIIGYTASQMYAMTDKTVFGHKKSHLSETVAVRYLIGDWSQLPYTYMPSAFGHTSAELGLLSALYIAVVALEMIVLTVYRTFPGLLQMDERISRKFICSAYLAAMFAYCYVANDEKTSGHFLETYYVLIPLPFLAILEIAVMVHLYRMPRFIVNMKTMLGKPPSKLWRANLFRAATAVLITPSIVVATLIYKVWRVAAEALENCGKLMCIRVAIVGGGEDGNVRNGVSKEGMKLQENLAQFCPVKKGLYFGSRSDSGQICKLRSRSGAKLKGTPC